MISLILHQFNHYVLLICGKKLVTIEIFHSSHLKLKAWFPFTANSTTTTEKNKAIICFSSHPSHKSLCFDSKLVVVVVEIGFIDTRPKNGSFSTIVKILAEIAILSRILTPPPPQKRLRKKGLIVTNFFLQISHT